MSNELTLHRPEFDELLDFIYENGTTSEGVLSRAERLCEAYARDYDAHMLRKMAGAVVVKVEGNRVWIVKAHQSFMLAYDADTAEELNWYAEQLRGVLDGFTPGVNADHQKLECEAKEAVFGLSNLLRHATADDAWCAEAEKPHLTKAIAAITKLAQARAAGGDTVERQAYDGMKAERDRLLHELEKREAAGAERDGWKLVPVLPNAEMLIRGGENFFDSARTWKRGSTMRDQDSAGSIYASMLAAAPSADDQSVKYECKCGHAVEVCLATSCEHSELGILGQARADDQEGRNG